LDVSSPLETAWKLHKAWPASELVVVPNDGHGGEAMIAELLHATARFAPAG
jgi:proline iminopeptidase